jgi:eukaryotic-like serine/threonine-protein kinase
MDQSSSERTLLAGLVAHRTGLVSRDALLAALRTWSSKPRESLEQILVTQGALASTGLAPVAAAIRQVLQDHDGNPIRGLAAFGPIGSLRQDLESLGNPGLVTALSHVEPDTNGSADIYATLADPSRTMAPAATPSASAAPDGWATLAFDDSAGQSKGASVAAAVDLTATQPIGEATMSLTEVPSAVAGADFATQAFSQGSQRSSVVAAPIHDPFQTQAFSEGPPTDVDGGTASMRPSWSGPAPQSTGASRFHILRPHAKGGLGEVFLARDEELNREVALKEIQGRHADHPESRLRFLVEAEVTGGLEHPGIVPVYGLGRYPDGRPYYAMRFIRGESLKEAIDRFHKADEEPDRAAGEREIELRKLLSQFIDVCNAMEYSHSRGVIHRDLKPANIMLGLFGETLVVDWGLAKFQDRAELTVDASSMPPLRPMSASGTTSATIYGSAIGTPQFMSPEQAEGKLDEMGPTSDVYSLGATLYYLLTGVTAFQDRQILSLLQKVKSADFPAPRQVNRRVPAALNAICVKAMALKPSDRYPSARALASDLERWLADEPVSCYLEPFRVRARRWAKLHRTAVTILSSVFLVGVVSLSVFSVVIKREKERTDMFYGMAKGAVDEMLTKLGDEDLADIPQMEPVRKSMLIKARAFYEKFLKERSSGGALQLETGEASVRLGDILQLLGEDANAEKAYDRAISLIQQLRAGDPKLPAYRQALARAYHQRGILHKRWNRFKESESDLREALKLRESLSKEFPNNTDYKHDENDSRYHLGAVLARLAGRVSEASDLYTKAINSQEQIAKAFPDILEEQRKLGRYRNNAGMLLKGRSARKAETEFRQALKIQQGVVAKAPKVAVYRSELASTFGNLGAVLSIRENEQDRKEAEEAYKQDLALSERLAQDFPRVPDYQNKLAAAHANLGSYIRDYVDRKKAMVEYDQAFEIQSRLVQRVPTRHDYQYQLSIIRRNRGIAFLSLADFRSAEDEFKANRDALRSLVATYPNLFRYRAELGVTLRNLAQALESENQFPEACEILKQAVVEGRTALSGDETNAEYKRLLYGHLRTQADVLATAGRFRESVGATEDWAKLLEGQPNQLVESAIMLLDLYKVIPDTVEHAKDIQNRFAKRAIELLREAVKQGYRNKDELDASDYDPIREMPEFKELRERLKNAEPFVG